MEALLTDRVVLVVGGTAGLGAGIARAALREGASVVVTGRRADRADAVVAELSPFGPISAVVADQADVAHARGVVAEAVARHGRVDCLVNAAGLTTRSTLLDTTPELFDEHVAVNLRGPFFTMQAAVADMVGRGDPRTVVNVITMSSHGGQPHLAAYSATKAGLVGLTKNVAHAHRFDRVRVNGLNIGWPRPRVRTRSSAASTAPATTGSSGLPPCCRWVGSVRSTRSPTPSSSSCPTGQESSRVPSSTGTRPS